MLDVQAEAPRRPSAKLAEPEPMADASASTTTVTPGVYFPWRWRPTEVACTQGVTLPEAWRLGAVCAGGGRRARKPCLLSHLGRPRRLGPCLRSGREWGEGRRAPGSLVTSQEVAMVPEESHVSFLTKLGRGPQK